jgi:hypothetical protein
MRYGAIKEQIPGRTGLYRTPLIYLGDKKMDRDNGQKTLDATYDKTKRATSEGRKVECPLFFPYAI